MKGNRVKLAKAWDLRQSKRSQGQGGGTGSWQNADTVLAPTWDVVQEGFLEEGALSRDLKVNQKEQKKEGWGKGVTGHRTGVQRLELQYKVTRRGAVVFGG